MADVLIAGAGPAGMTLAIELLRRGVDVRVVDVADGPSKGSRGKGIQPRSLEIFDMIGIVDEVLANSTLYPFIKVHLGPPRRWPATAGGHARRHSGASHDAGRKACHRSPRWVYRQF